MLGTAIITAFLLMLSGLASVFETSLTAVNSLKIKVKAESGDIKAIKILKILDNYDSAITSIVIFDNIINIFLPIISLMFCMSIFKVESIAASVSTIVMSFLVIIFGEIVPKIFGRTQAENALFHTVNLIDLLIKLMKPITYIINSFTKFFKDKCFPEKISEDDFDEEIITMVNEEHEHGNLEEKQRNLITKAVIFNDKIVENIMQPKHKVIMVSNEDSNLSIYKVLISAKFSRIPVYDEQTKEIIGVLNEREFLSNYAKNKQFDKTTVISKPLFVPDSLKISNLLPKMQNSKNQMAIVLDEYGDMQGIISVEDILEELVGDIWDEHDDVVKRIRRLKDGSYLISSDVLLSELEDIINIDYDEDQTIARYMLDTLGKLPEIDDEIDTDSYALIIKSIKNNSIDQILISFK